MSRNRTASFVGRPIVPCGGSRARRETRAAATPDMDAATHVASRWRRDDRGDARPSAGATAKGRL